jgi:hypothetical protein
MKGKPGRHQRHQTLPEEHAHFVQDSAERQKGMEQGDTSEDCRGVYRATHSSPKQNVRVARCNAAAGGRQDPRWVQKQKRPAG